MQYNTIYVVLNLDLKSRHPNLLTTNTMSLQKIKSLLPKEAYGGLLLVCATIIAISLANSSYVTNYNFFLQFPIRINLGSFDINKPMLLWINDGLMAIFFFHVGLEIKREVLFGQLSSLKKISLPFLAAIMGIIVPSIIYLCFNFNNPTAIKGWAIPSSTDIAFAVGVYSLFGKYLPPGLKLFLLSVATIDDISVVAIIALFYNDGLSTTPLFIALIGLCGLFLLNRLNLFSKTVFSLVSFMIWAAVLKSGVHATLAGFAIAWCIPINKDPEKSISSQIEHSLSPWVTIVILPLFAFANAGVSVTGLTINDIFTPVSLGVLCGLLIGKPMGVMFACWLTVTLGISSLPKGVNWIQLYGVSLLCGIGFTMSLFVGTLAFDGSMFATLIQVKVGVLLGSLFSAVLGAIAVSITSRNKKFDRISNNLHEA